MVQRPVSVPVPKHVAIVVLRKDRIHKDLLCIAYVRLSVKALSGEKSSFAMQRRKEYHVSLLLVVSSTDTAIMEYACEVEISNVTGMIKLL